MRSTSAFCAILFGLLACTATKTNAQIVEYAYEAVVTEVEEGVSAPLSDVQVGDLMTGHLRYDLATPGENAGQLTHYPHPSADLPVLTLEVRKPGGEVIFETRPFSDPFAPDVFAGHYHNFSGVPIITDLGDVFWGTQRALVDSDTGPRRVSLFLSLIERLPTGNRPFVDTSLPKRLDLSSFTTERSIEINLFRSSIFGELTSLTLVVPEPASATLIAIAIISISLRRR